MPQKLKQIKVRDLVCILIAFPALVFSQQTSKTSGPCSPIAPNNTGIFMIQCPGISDKLGHELIDILNRIKENQLNPDAVNAKLDELLSETKDIKQGVDEIRKKQEGRRLSDAQRQFLIPRLASVPNKPRIKIMITNNTPESMRFAEDIESVFEDKEAGGWHVDMFPNMVVGTILPKGQSIIVKSKENGVAGFIQRLFATLGITLSGSLGTDVDPDSIVIAIWPMTEDTE